MKKKTINKYQIRDSFGISWLLIFTILGLIFESFEAVGIALVPYFLFWIMEGMGK